MAGEHCEIDLCGPPEKLRTVLRQTGAEALDR